MKQSRGVSLVEMMFVLLVMAAITLVVFNQISKRGRSSNVVEISSSVQVLMSGLSNYYFENCATLSRTDVNNLAINDGSDASLTPDYIANPDVLRNPLSSASGAANQNSYQLSIFWDDTNNHWNNVVTAVFTSDLVDDNSLNVYAGSLNPTCIGTADPCDSNNALSLTWFQNPRSAAGTSVSSYSPEVAGLAGFDYEESYEPGRVPEGFLPDDTQQSCSVLDAKYIHDKENN